VLRRNGYRVHTILAGDHTDFYALKRYYGPVDDWFDGSSAHARFMNDDQLLIDRTATLASWDGTPAMIQYHLMSVHIMRKSDTHGEFQPSSNYMLQPSSDTGSTSETLQTATNFYDNGVVTADGVIANLLGQLKQKGYLENALVVITADHGESLGEHGLFRHANSVREELLKVPVVFIAFGYSPARSITASPYPLQIDIAPTVLAELGIPQPATWDGRPMQDAGQRPVIYFEERAFAGLIDRREPGNVWKYWIDRDDGHEHAFNLINDPHEMYEMSAIPAGQLARWRSEVLYKRD